MTNKVRPADGGTGGPSDAFMLLGSNHERTENPATNQAFETSRLHEVLARRCAFTAMRSSGCDAVALAALAGFHARAAVALMTGAAHG
jgi:hypothetical protein